MIDPVITDRAPSWTPERVQRPRVVLKECIPS